MKTKYDWSNVPDDVKWIATEQNGYAHGWSGKPSILFGDHWNSSECIVTMFYIRASENPFRGKWQDSLEERPK